MSSTIVERQRINSGAAVKVPCKAATTANITLSGEQTIDGVACVTNDRVLVKNQTTASENGIYLCNTSTWSRAKDWDGSFDVKQGTFVYVNGGTSSGFWYVTTSTDPIVPGTTSVTIAQASSQLVTFSAFIQTLLDDANLAAMLASMGFSSDMQSFLQTANDAAALTALGVSSFAQTVLDDTSAATARTTLGAAGLTDNNDLSGDNDIKDTLEIYDPSDTTKKIRFDAGSVSPATTRVITAPDRDITLADPLTSGTAQATTSGTSIDFTSIPSWVTRITIMLSGVSTNGTSVILFQIGDSGGVETSGYLGSGSGMGAAVASANYTTGFGYSVDHTAASVVHGELELALLDAATNTWVATGKFGRSDQARSDICAGSKALSATLDRVRITTVGGVNTFDAGSINILYE